jgi:WD40 repeat protein
MDLLCTYGQEEPEDNEGAPALLQPRLLSSTTGVRAPALAPSGGPAGHAMSAMSSALRSGYMEMNLPVAIMYAPVVGPVGAGGARAETASSGAVRTLTGLVAPDSMDPATFAAQYNSYNGTGYAADPTGSGAVIGAGTATRVGSVARATASAPPGVKRARQNNDDASDAAGYLGPWAGFEGEQALRTTALSSGVLTLKQRLLRLDQGLNPDAPGKLEKDEVEKVRARVLAEAEAEKKAGAEAGAGAGAAAPDVAAGGSGEAKRARAEAAPAAVAVEAAPEARGVLSPAECKSTFSGAALFDYQGRSWMDVPKGVRADGGEHECFVPKKLVHTWSGHAKGVNSVQFFPGTGHLLLTASLDGKAKVWDTATNKGVRRTYSGHTAGVRQARWSLNGRAFATASFDRSAKAWDTETGACIASWSPGPTPLCLAWAPNQGDKVLLVGTQKKKILQYDLRVPGSEPSLEYDYHLGPVNAISFYDEGRRFLSAGDDCILVWDVSTPVPIKHIADPSQHAVTAAALHPDGGSWVGQSMDNSLAVFSLGDRISRNIKKTFKGHIVAGYACQPAFSSDGRFLASGDGDGQAWFWDWRSHRVLNKFKAHEGGPSAGMDWHPLQPSWVVTAGWDGLVKLWD